MKKEQLVFLLLVLVFFTVFLVYLAVAVRAYPSTDICCGVWTFITI